MNNNIKVSSFYLFPVLIIAIIIKVVSDQSNYSSADAIFTGKNDDIVKQCGQFYFQTTLPRLRSPGRP